MIIKNPRKGKSGLKNFLPIHRQHLAVLDKMTCKAVDFVGPRYRLCFLNTCKHAFNH